MAIKLPPNNNNKREVSPQQVTAASQSWPEKMKTGHL
jgi:hypothetical protein